MKYYLTTPIYYVNDSPHIGHAYTTIAADVGGQWQRLLGNDVFFLTGTDEHGAKICQAAEKAGQDPKKFCDNISKEFSDEWKNLKITNDGFIRTTDDKHIKAVQMFLSKMKESGAVQKGKYKGLYCVHCEKFLLEGDLIDGCCPDHKQKPVPHSEENWFFMLSKYQQKLLDIISDENNPDIKIFPITRRNEIIGKLKAMKLENVSISRANVKWGVPLPFDTTQTAYVWVDALLNYITALGYADNSETYRKFWPAEVQLMAKDILWFHSVIWPAMLMATGLPLPKKVFSHGFFTINNDKMSKTLGNVITPKEMTDKFGVDATRYLTLALFPFGSDGDISWDALTNKYNTDLANNLGNLVSRTLTMIEKYCEAKVPQQTSNYQIFSVKSELETISNLYENLAFNKIIEQLQKAINLSNQYIEKSAPWKLAKAKDSSVNDVLFNLIQNIGYIAIYLLPFMPDVAKNIWNQIGESSDLEQIAKEHLSGKEFSFSVPGNPIKKTSGLFPRLLIERK